jgi:hypothetical protein
MNDSPTDSKLIRFVAYGKAQGDQYFATRGDNNKESKSKI